MGWVLGGAAGLLALYMFLTAPKLLRRKNRRKKFPTALYAHRGLHGGDIPENSLSAFRRAAEKGYGIELDVRLTRDGRLAVMHDSTLTRMCGVDGRVEEMTLSQIRALTLPGGQEHVPAFSDALAAAQNAPLIVEMKSEKETRKSLPSVLLKEMEGYPGFWCVESFDPRMVRWFRKNAPHVLRGQLAYAPARLGEHRWEIRYALAARLLFNALSRPDFIAYGHETDENLSFRIMRRLFRPVLAAWTVTTKKDFERLRNKYDLQIFEGFEPAVPMEARRKGEKRS